MNGDHRRVGAVSLPIEVMADRPLVNDERGSRCHECGAVGMSGGNPV
jgi:hypothetical protein